VCGGHARSGWVATCFGDSPRDEQVAAARSKIAAGTSLRAAAAEIGCAPSTLSVRIKKAEAAEADAGVRLGIGDRQPPPPTHMRADFEPPASGAREGTLAAGGDPLEVLRGALQATKATGQPGLADPTQRRPHAGSAQTRPHGDLDLLASFDEVLMSQ
jgi:hypothetical protein